MSKTNHEFERGYYCAVAALIKMDGLVSTQAGELFGAGGNPHFAYGEDIDIFIEHGLMEPRKRSPRS